MIDLPVEMTKDEDGLWTGRVSYEITFRVAGNMSPGTTLHQVAENRVRNGLKDAILGDLRMDLIDLVNGVETVDSVEVLQAKLQDIITRYFSK